MENKELIEAMDKKLNGFNNGRDTTDGVGGGESLEDNVKWCAENMEIKETQLSEITKPKNDGSYLLVDINVLPILSMEGITESLKNGKITIVKSEPTLQEAIKVLQKHLREDEDYYNQWVVNLGKYFIEEYKITKEKHKISEIAFKAAKNFLDNLIKE